MLASASPITHVLLDRDGVLNVERAGVPVTRPELWEWIEGSAAAVDRLVTAGVPVGVASNQSIVGRGVITSDELDAIHEAAMASLSEGSAALDFILCCPHAPDAGCRCRKPAPGLLEQAARRWGVESRRVLFIGDAITDWEASRRADTEFALVQTGKGAETEDAIEQRGELDSLWCGRSHPRLAEVVDELLAARRRA